VAACGNRGEADACRIRAALARFRPPPLTPLDIGAMPFRRSRPLPPILFSFISPAKRGWLDYRFGRASKPNLEKNLSNRVKRAAGGKQAACASSLRRKTLIGAGCARHRIHRKTFIENKLCRFQFRRERSPLLALRTRKMVKDRTFVPFFRKNAGRERPD